MNDPAPRPVGPGEDATMGRPEPVPRRRVLLAGLLFEGGLGLVAVLIGTAVGLAPRESLGWDARGVLWGVAATPPMLVALLVALRSDGARWHACGSSSRSWPGPCWPTAPWPTWPCWRPRPGSARNCCFGAWSSRPSAPGSGPRAAWPWPASCSALTSVLFGLVHPLSPVYVIAAGGLGAYLGVLWLASGNLLAPIVAHGLYDLVALVVLVKLGGGSAASSS